MSMKIAHNISAINTNKNLYTSNRMMDSSLEKLSSGYRINSGKDGPADLVISEKLRAQTAGLERAVRNTTESINTLSIAEGALNEMNAILKKMKALAIHSANNGITSPEQVAADQAEMDSGIQTLERIANTTKSSDQFLLNGSKDITYSANTEVKGTQNNKLMNDSLTNFSQIFKRDGYGVSITFQGALSTGATGTFANTGIADANMKMQATKAYLEVDTVTTTKSQVNTEGRLTQGQSFILTGKLGSRQFDFSQGAHVSEIVTAIKNVAGSTGVDAALTFNSNQEINAADTASEVNAASIGAVDNLVAGSQIIYDNYKVNATGDIALIATMDAAATAANIQYGFNTDGQGNIYAKVVADAGGVLSWEYYKDASLSKESLVGTAADGGAIVARNNSNLDGLTLTTQAAAAHGDVVKINLGNVLLDADNVVSDSPDIWNLDTSTAAGVQLGVNTDESGKIYIKSVWNHDGDGVTVYAYKDALMREEDLVAQTAIDDVSATATGGGVILDAIWNDEHTASTGLGLALTIGTYVAADVADTTQTFELQFKNQGMRVYSSDYGSDSLVQVQQTAGSLFTTYENQADAKSARVIESGETFRLNGQDATVNVNGKQMKTNGLNLSLATQDIMANISFNAGKTGSTTIAQVGYGEGSIFSKNTALTMSESAAETAGANTGFSGLLNNAGHTTQERVGNFNGGMQLQLGEGSGDQERTVVSLKSMSTANLGRIEVTQQFDKSKSIIETRSVSIQDVMSGQVASLSSDPTLAMKIIEKAISDVSEMRSQIGAVQTNMLQTNENNLRVAIENITKMESDIRDTDMASEMTEFTKNQVLASAGVSMLSQANAQSQNVLSLLR